MEHSLAESRRNLMLTGLMFVDLDGFKAVNDRLGHDAGDRVLCAVAARLVACVREVDSVARIGGDEFLVILQDLEDDRGAAIVAERILDAVKADIWHGDQNASVGASIGVALSTGHGESTEALIKRADAHMYQVKERGKNGFSIADLPPRPAPVRKRSPRGSSPRLVLPDTAVKR